MPHGCFPWNLTAEAVAVDLAPAQSDPETDFRSGHLGAEPVGTLNIGSRGGVHLGHLE